MAIPMSAFAVMADPVRRRIVEVLADGEHTAGEIAAAVGWEFRISRTAISKHLRVLRDADFVDVVADLKWRWYFLTAEGLERIEDEVAELRSKMIGGLGKDPFGIGLRDPWRVAAPRYPVAVKGPGRDPRPGTRGRQTVGAVASEPDVGIFPTYGRGFVTQEGPPTWPPRIDG